MGQASLKRFNVTEGGVTRLLDTPDRTDGAREIPVGPPRPTRSRTAAAPALYDGSVQTGEPVDAG